jgi:uncharacterized protein
MATMSCPRCPKEQLDERERDGVTIDCCPSCRGIWLDRGELEKLITRGRTESDDYRSRARSSDGPPSSDDHRRGKKKSWFDIFD